ncbi:DUF6340 family protein [Putridiphycobacter roseus]|nr:DUF6340 family protein [Putridiphycobacter roseus]
MKKEYILLWSFIVLGLASCKQQVYLTITQPAAVYLAPELQSAAVVNRSFTTGNSKVIDILEKGLTLEGDIDKKGAQQIITSFFDQLSLNPQMKIIKILDSLSVVNGPVANFPNPLNWDEVADLTSGNNAQLLFSLELYDTDTQLKYGTQKVNKATPLGNIPFVQHTATVTTFIKTGWRIYDVETKQIIDEFILTNDFVSSGSGITPIMALAAIANREPGVINLSSRMGEYYASRLLDQQVSVYRTFYKKGSDALKMANRKAEVKDWKGAGEIWRKEMTASTKSKTKGRATYNMAIYEEIYGNLDQALLYAQEAYTTYNIKMGKEYARIIQQRINNNQYLK